MDTEQKEATEHPARFPKAETQTIEIGIRPCSKGDRNYVHHTWVDSFARFGYFNLRVDPELARRCHQSIVEAIYADHTTLVAYDLVEVRAAMGFVCGDDYPHATLVHYLYVPRKLRGWGIGKALLRRLGWSEGKPIIYTHLTKDLTPIDQAGKHTLIHNPYLMFDNHRKILHGKTTPRQVDRSDSYEYKGRLFSQQRRENATDRDRSTREATTSGFDPPSGWEDSSDGGPEA